MRKAIIFTLDLLASIMLFSSFLLLISTMNVDSNYDDVVLYNYAKDALYYIDFNNLNDTLYLPNNVKYNLEIVYYDNYSNIVEIKTIGYPLPDDYVSVKRVFYFNSSFGIANLRLWI